MKKLLAGGQHVLLLVSALVLVLGLAGTNSEALAQKELPDLAPMGIDDDRAQFRPVVTNRLGGPTFEFSILTANIGGQDFLRPRDPATGQYLLRQIYQWNLWWFNPDIEDWELIRVARKNTICTIDDTRRGNVFPCIQEHGPRYTCGGVQGVSRGWADDYFRGLNGQWIFIGDYVGDFWLEAELDPDRDLEREDIPESGRDATHDNNYADILFNWDGETLTMQQVIYYIDLDLCASGGCKQVNE